ncbi:MAG: hypothetical protein L0H70_07170, partial [Xanthomonadales bacterium]|nr:hypothetical protein [Xanthomonadales bacterium]
SPGSLIRPTQRRLAQVAAVGVKHGQPASRRLECMPALELFFPALEQASFIGLRALLHLKAAFA